MSSSYLWSDKTSLWDISLKVSSEQLLFTYPSIFPKWLFISYFLFLLAQVAGLALTQQHQSSWTREASKLSEKKMAAAWSNYFSLSAGITGSSSDWLYKEIVWGSVLKSPLKRFFCVLSCSESTATHDMATVLLSIGYGHHFLYCISIPPTSG